MRLPTPVLALFLLLLQPGLAVAQALFTPTQEPLAGSRVFGTKGCVKCHAINSAGGKVGPELFAAHKGELLQLAAVATVADVVPLRAGNRHLVRRGLGALNATPTWASPVGAASSSTACRCRSRLRKSIEPYTPAGSRRSTCSTRLTVSK